MAPMQIVLRVHVDVRPDEHVYVVGNVMELGAWQPCGALAMIRDYEHPNQWVASVEVSMSEPVEYRYFIAQFLDPFKDKITRKELIVARWETFIKPRRINTVADLDAAIRVDEFGRIDQNSAPYEDEGWLTSQSDVRLRLHGRAVQFWKSKYNDTSVRVRVIPFDLRHRGADGSIDDEDLDSHEANPVLPSHTRALISILSDTGARFADQEPYGTAFNNDKDYFIFRVQSVAPEFLAFRFEFFTNTGNAASPASATEKQEHIGFGYLLPTNLKDSFGNRVVSITNLRHQPIGQVSVDYLIVHPLHCDGVRPDMSVSYSKYWRKRSSALDIGHRGMGNSYTKFAIARENTISSLRAAAVHGADYVEFDVQLTKDLVPVIYHDFAVCITAKRRTSNYDLPSLITTDTRDYELYEMPMKDLKLRQLHMLKVSHVSERAKDGAEQRKYYGVNDVAENQPFPTLKQMFQSIDVHVGFNVEVKYPMMEMSGKWECEHFHERNDYVDKIVECVLNDAGQRRVVFSSFEPDICVMLKLKQNRYPVLFLTQGTTKRYTPFIDERANRSDIAVYFALSSQILGVSFHAEDLLRDPTPLHLAKKFGLVSFVWGDDLDSSSNIKSLRQLGVDGLIYDRISEPAHHQGGKLNVFLLEQQEQEALLKGSRPTGSVSKDSMATSSTNK